MELSMITPADIRSWHADNEGANTARASAYGLLKTILAGAVEDELITSNPCHIRGGSSTKRQHRIEPATPAQIEVILEHMPERYRLMVLLGSWCALRFGEVTELRRGDIDLKDGRVHVQRAVAWVHSKPIVGTPKSSAGFRDVAIPPHLMPAVKAHLRSHVPWGQDALLFPATRSGDHLTHGSFFSVWKPARHAAGRDDLRFHDLRHTGAVYAAQAGATIAELMNRLGHTTPMMAMRYQHASQDRDAEIARRLSLLATGGRPLSTGVRY
jgi:integrase